MPAPRNSKPSKHGRIRCVLGTSSRKSVRGCTVELLGNFVSYVSTLSTSVFIFLLSLIGVVACISEVLLIHSLRMLLKDALTLRKVDLLAKEVCTGFVCILLIAVALISMTMILESSGQKTIGEALKSSLMTQ